MASADYMADLYEWLQAAYDAAIHMAQPHQALQYIVMMKALEDAGHVVAEEEPQETIH